MGEEEILAITLLFIVLIGLAYALIAYLFTAFAYFRLAQANGEANLAFLAWIPVANFYLIFLLILNGNREERVKGAITWISIYAVLFIVSFIPFVGLIGNLGIFGISLYIMYRLFYLLSGDSTKGVLYTILSLITIGIFSIIYFMLKRNTTFILQEGEDNTSIKDGMQDY